MKTVKQGYDFKPLEEAGWAIFLAILGAGAAYFNGLDLGSNLDPKVVGAGLVIVIGRAAIGGAQAAIPKLVGTLTPQQALTVDQIAALLDKKLDERLGVKPPFYLSPGVETTPGSRVPESAAVILTGTNLP